MSRDRDLRISHYLLEGMLNGGLSFVGAYLEKQTGSPVIITDALGRINYPDMTDTFYKAEDLFIDIPEDCRQDAYYYSSQNRLYCRVQNKTSLAYVIVENIIKEKCHDIQAVVAHSELALKYYFSTKNKSREEFGQSLWENFFLSADAGMQDRLRILEQNMDINNYYFVSILDVEEGTAALDWNLLRSYIYETLNRDRTEYITSIIAPGRLVNILKGQPPDGPMGIDPDWLGREGLESTRQIVEEHFNITFSQGLGRAYRPSGLLQSYKEACISLALPRLSGKRHFIQFFSQLGVFTPIFSHDDETVKNYCLQVLGKIIEYDRKQGTDLLGTLRILLDNACSWTNTANQMYVHVNTVYYRMLKVEQLLGVEFNNFETRLHLYTAIRAWDTLHICKLLE